MGASCVRLVGHTGSDLHDSRDTYGQGPGEGNVMLPMLIGLFRIPVLLESSSSGKIPRQRDRGNDPVRAVPETKGMLIGTVTS